MPSSIPPISDPEFAATAFLMMLLGWISFVDIRTFRIPDPVVILLTVAGFAISIYFKGSWPLTELIGALAGFGSFALLGEAYYRHTGQDGLGLGDAKLLGAAGAWLGWQPLPLLVALAAVLALTYALAVKRKKLAFGPWLAASFLILWIARLTTGHLAYL